MHALGSRKPHVLHGKWKKHSIKGQAKGGRKDESIDVEEVLDLIEYREHNGKTKPTQIHQIS